MVGLCRAKRRDAISETGGNIAQLLPHAAVNPLSALHNGRVECFR
jgi:hypothetical protein